APSPSICRFLFEFLREVAMHSSTNRMTSENLAIVWAPNLLRPQVCVSHSVRPSVCLGLVGFSHDRTTNHIT
ncbi:unnamed protein product, partial [Ectocarpus fasciculatus]